MLLSTFITILILGGSISQSLQIFNNNNNEVLIKREPLVLPELGALYKKKKKDHSFDRVKTLIYRHLRW